MENRIVPSTLLVVNTTSDSDAVQPSNGSGLDNNGKISIRSALETAEAVGSNAANPFTINIPDGTYNLTLGPLQAGSSLDANLVLNGVDQPSNIVVKQTDNTDPVFNLNPSLNANVQISLTNLKITGGNAQSFGGGGIIGGGIGNSLTLTNVVVTGNAAHNGPGGGGIEFDGGTLTLKNCTISNNTAFGGNGGGIDFHPQGQTNGLSITGTTFSGNAASTISSAGGLGGGLYIAGSGGNTYNISGSTFTGNQASANGGAIANAHGTLAFSFNRVAGNSTASGSGTGVYNGSASDASFTATNNWWGTNQDPSTVNSLIAGTVATNPWLVVAASASPTTLAPGATSSITASFLQNSAGTAISASSLSALVGVPVTFSATGGTVAPTSSTIQSGGTANTTYTAGSTLGSGTASVAVDNGLSAANLTITTPTASADLAVSGSGPATVIAGAGNGIDNLAYTVTVHNNGPDNTSSVQITNSLNAPLGTTVSTDSTASQGTFNVGTGVWTVGTLNNGATATLTLMVSVASSVAPGSLIQESASVANSVAGDPNSSNNTSNTVSTTVQTQADLAITNTAPVTAVAGSTSGYTYAVTVTNNGPSANTGGFTVTDTLPAGTTFQSSGSTPGWTANGQALTFNTGSALGSGASQTLMLNVTVGSGVAGGTVLTDTASVASNGTTDPSSANNTSNTASTTVVTSASADLSIANSGPANATAGDPNGYTYTLLVTNNGPGANSGGFTVTDTLPTGTAYLVSTSTAGWVANGQTLTFTSSSGLANGAPQTIVLGVTVNSSMASGTVLQDTASVASNGTTDFYSGNNTSNNVSTTVQTAQHTLTVNTTTDSDAAKPSSGTGLDSNGKISLRSALETAEAVGSNASTPFTINIPAGTYTLTLGPLQAGSSVDGNLVLSGTGVASNTLIKQTDNNDPVFNLNPSLNANVQVSMSNVEITGGNSMAFGGGGIIGGGVGNSLILTSVIVTGNAAHNGGGGGIEFDGGSLTLTGCTISNNTALGGPGGGVDFEPSGMGGNLTITGTTFSGNSSTTLGSGVGTGGAIYINGSAGNTYTITGSTFLNNQATTSGGALANTHGTLSFNFNRLVGNTAPSGSGVFNGTAADASVDARNNWWGNNLDPSTVSGLIGGTGSTNPWLVLGATASPASLNPGTTSTITAGFTRNSSGIILSASSLTALVGLPVTFTATGGTIAPPSGTIQSSGQATAIYTAGGALGSGTASVAVDSAKAVANLVITAPTTTADLGVTASGPTTVTAGASGGTDNLTYTITIQNNGPNSASSVQVTNTLTAPSGVLVSVDTSASQGTFNTTTGIWSVGTLANGSSATLTLQVNVAGSVTSGATIQESAAITASSATDPNSANNTTNTVTTTVQTQADLSITAAGPANAAVGDPAGYFYTLTVTDNGPSANTGGFTVTDTLPSGTTFQAAGSDPAWSANGQALTFTTGTGLASSGTRTILIQVTIPSSVATGTVLQDSATVASNGTTDPTSSNNTSNVVSTTVVANTNADLSISNAGPTSVIAGDPAGYTYTLTVTNNGPSSNVGGFTITDTLPTGVTFQSSGSTSGWTANGQTLTFTTSSGLANSGTQTILLHVTVGSSVANGTVLHDSATVASNGTTDPVSGNNTSSTINTTVQTQADLSITNAGPPTANAGNSSGYTYTLTVTNNGPSVNTGGFTVTDTLPNGTTFQPSGSDPGWTANGQALTFSTTTGLASGASRTILIQATVGASVPSGTVLQDSAVVSSNGTTDSNSSNNTSNVVSTTVEPLSSHGLTVTTTTDSDAVNPSAGNGLDSTGNISLRSAAETAEAVGSSNSNPFTIFLPTGTYKLTLGPLLLGSATDADVAVAGTGSATNTIIQQTDGVNRVFILNNNLDSNVAVSFSNVEITGGVNTSSFGGAGILAGGPGNTLTLTNVILTGNTTSNSNGGGLSFEEGGSLVLTGCTVSNNLASGGTGGGVDFEAGGTAGSLTVTNSVFSNNNSTSSGHLGGQGGAININGLAGNSYSISGSTFLGNKAGVSGGALANAHGAILFNFNRVVGNTAPSGSGVFNGSASDASIDATNTWWGSNQDPSTINGLIGGTVTSNPWLMLGTTASPTTLAPGATATVTASFLQNSAGTTVPASSLKALVGLPVSFSATLGTMAPTAATIQSTGQATSTFTAGSASGPASASATVDSGTSTANVTITGSTPTADLGVTASGPTTVTAGSSAGKDNLTYTITLTNNGPNSADNVQVTDMFTGASGATISGDTSASQGTFNSASGVWTVGTLASGATATLTLLVNVASSTAVGTVIKDSAAITASSATDPNQANNTSSTVSTTVQAQADLQVTNADNEHPNALQGSTITYTVTVKNPGPSDAVGTTVADSFPAILSNVTYTAAQTGGATGFTANGSGNLNDTITFPAGSIVTYTLQALVNSTATGTLSTTATVTPPASVSDPSNANNSATDSDTLVVVATQLAVSASPTATAGTPFNLTVTAQDAAGHTAAAFSGTATLASSLGSDLSPTSVALSSGTATIPVTLTGAGSQTVTASFTGLNAGSATVKVSPGALGKYLVAVQGPTTVQAGAGQLLTVQAADSYGNPITSYSGPSTLTASVSPGGGASNFPTTVAVSAGGFGLFLANLQTVGTYTISVAGGGFSGSAAPVTVTPGPASKLAFGTPPVNTPTGDSLPPVTVQVEDYYGNLVTSDNTDSVTLGIASGPGAFTAGSTTTAMVHNGVATFGTLMLTVPGTYTFSEVDPNTYTGPNSIPFTVLPLQVVPSSFVGTPSGFSLQFNAPYLVNSLTPVLYGTGLGTTAPSPSVILTTDPGNLSDTASIVPGTLVLSPATNSMTFLATNTTLEVNNGSPLLPDGVYSVVVRSSAATDGFQALNSGGGFLDGLANGTAGSGDFLATFTVNAAAAKDDVVWVPPTAEGPGQSLNAPGMNQVGGGYPIYLSDSTGSVSNVQVTLNYNPALLQITGVTGAGFSLLASSTPGQAVLQYSGPALKTGSQVPVGFVNATVPGGTKASPMPYKAKDLLHLSSVSLNSGTVPVVTSDGVHLVAFVGDANGDGTYSSADSVLITRVNLQADSGFAAYPLVDATIVVDTDGSGFIPADAALQVNEAGVGFQTANLPSPPIPAGVVFQAVSNNVDPSLSLVAGGAGRVTGTVAVAVNIDDARPMGSSGLTEAHLALMYDPHVLSVSAADIHAGLLLTQGSGWTVSPTINAITGEIAVVLSSDTPLTGSGSLVTIDFHQLSAGPGSISIALVGSINPTGQQVFMTELDDAQGRFILTPAPTNGMDANIATQVMLTASPHVAATMAEPATPVTAEPDIIEAQIPATATVVLAAPTASDEQQGPSGIMAPEALTQGDEQTAAPGTRIIVATAASSKLVVAEPVMGLGWVLAATAPVSALVITVGNMAACPGLCAATTRATDPWTQAVGRATLNDYDAALLLSLANMDGSDQPSWDAAVLSDLQRNPDKSVWPGRPDARNETRTSTVPAEPLQEAAVSSTVLDRLFAQTANETEDASDIQDGN